MSAVIERPVSIAKFETALASRETETPTFEQTSFAYGGSLPPTHTQSRAHGISRVLDKLYSYRGLCQDWDGYGGEPATYASFSNAVEFVNRLPIRFNAPVSMLAGDGEISLFWKDSGCYLEVSFPGDNTYHFIFQNDYEQYASADIPLDGNGLDAAFIAYLDRI
jgi:hypothetical protein